MASTVWRVRVSSVADDLEISEIRLCDVDGVAIDSAASVTCSFTPISGSIANLRDGDLNSTALFSRAQWSATGFYFEFTFPVAVTPVIVNFGSGAEDKWVDEVVIFERAAGVDTPTNTIRGYDYPGPATMSDVAVAFIVDKLVDYSLGNPGQVFVEYTDAGSCTQAYTSPVMRFTSSGYNWAGVISGTKAAPTARVKLDYTIINPNTGNAGIIGAFFRSTSSSNVAVMALLGMTGTQGTAVTKSNAQNTPALALTLKSTPMTIPTSGRHQFEATLEEINGSKVIKIYIDGSLVDSHTISSSDMPIGATYQAGIYIRSSIHDIHSVQVATADKENITATFATQDSRPGMFPLAREAEWSAPSLEEIRVIDVKRGIFAGLGKIEGSVREKAGPSTQVLKRKLVLYDELSTLPVDVTWSDPATGDYVFKDLSMEYRYTIVAYDYPHVYGALAADNKAPVPME